jgi:multidrug resistance protein
VTGEGPRGRRSRAGPLFVVLFTVFIDLLGFGIVLPILPYYAKRFGASELMIGVIIASFSLMQFLFAPFWGRLSDKYGRRPVLLISVAGSVLSYAQFALADSLGALLISRVLAGIAGANIAAAQAYIADITPPAERARGMGYIGAAFGLGFTIGPGLAGFAHRWGPEAPGWLAAGLSLVNLVLAWFLLPESLPPERRADTHRRAVNLEAARRVMRHAVLAPVGWLFCATSFAAAALTSMLALFLEARFRMGETSAANVFALMGLVIAVVQGGFVHPLVRRLGERAVALGGVSLLTATLFFFPVALSRPLLYVAVLLYAVAIGVTGPSAISLVSRVADAREQGEVIGVVQSLASLARVVGPLWGGFTFRALGISAPFVSGGVACALVAVYFWRTARRDWGLGIGSTRSPNPNP